ncbi:glycosyltransferase family 4 protein [Candidatus Ulvibacter alkanivorans]|uniref:glycosyltransferase family 4 protein n=1 Tax=Candidatus Ulvibacter alkanivorans TaxID=2267620 RepID=UPI000DF39D15|nr:glycosyltransferase family 4 protein [Candidatus Ulvibacter alkanivorans]
MATNDILLVTNYFPPEKGAAANRMLSLAEALVNHKMKVAVVCPLPNYPTGSIYSTFKGKLYAEEAKGDITIYRLWVWPSNSSNKFIRLLSMLSFACSLSLFFLFGKIPPKVFVQYSPVFVGFTAVWFAWLFRKKIVLNISDLWPLAGLEMGLLKKGSYYRLLEKMERFCYRKAHLVVGQSKEILTHVSSYYPNKKMLLYRNLPRFDAAAPKETKHTTTITLVYAGLLGVAQGLYTICKHIDFSENVSLHLYGNGPEAAAIAALNKPNIHYHGEVSREQLHTLLIQHDIAFIPLVKRIYGSVPSKIFEYTRLGLPVLYNAGGEGEKLVVTHELGWVLPVQDMDALQAFVNSLSLEKLSVYPKNKVQQRALQAFDFDTQFSEFFRSIEAL